MRGDRERPFVLEQVGSFWPPSLICERWSVGLAWVALTTTPNVTLWRSMTICLCWPPVRWLNAALVQDE